MHRSSPDRNTAARAEASGKEVQVRFITIFRFTVFSGMILRCRGYGVVSMCIGTGMGAAAVFEYPGK